MFVVPYVMYMVLMLWSLFIMCVSYYRDVFLEFHRLVVIFLYWAPKSVAFLVSRFHECLRTFSECSLKGFLMFFCLFDFLLFGGPRFHPPFFW
jgi:hypothetical protein